MKLYGGSKLNLNAIALDRDCDAEKNVFAFIEDENGLRVFGIEVRFNDDSNSFRTHEMLYCYVIDEGEFIADGVEYIGESESFCLFDYIPDNEDLNENDTYREADKRRDAALMQYLEKRFEELKTLEEKGELENYLRENGYVRLEKVNTDHLLELIEMQDEQFEDFVDINGFGEAINDIHFLARHCIALHNTEALSYILKSFNTKEYLEKIMNECKDLLEDKEYQDGLDLLHKALDENSLEETYLRNFEKFAKPLEKENLTPLEQKNVEIAEDMDFAVYFFDDEKGERFYILFDVQRGKFYEYLEEGQDIRESAYSSNDLSEILEIIPDNYFEDHNYDINKVFDKNILNIEDCFQQENEIDNHTITRR